MTLKQKILVVLGLMFLIQSTIIAQILTRNTHIMAPGFTLDGFTKLRPGMTRAEVEKLIGPPLYLQDDRPRGSRVWLKPSDAVVGKATMYYSTGPDLPTAYYAWVLVQLHKDGTVMRLAIKQRIGYGSYDREYFVYDFEETKTEPFNVINSKLFPARALSTKKP